MVQVAGEALYHSGIRTHRFFSFFFMMELTCNLVWVDKRFFPCALKRGKTLKYLTGLEWSRIQHINHLLRNHNGLIITFELVNWMPGVTSMLNKLLYVFFIEGIHDIEEIITVWKSPFRHLIRKIPHEFRLFHSRWPQVSYGQLIVHWNVNKLDTIKCKQLFIFRENLSEEVFIDHKLWWHI